MDKYHQTNPPTELKSVILGRKNSRKATSEAPSSAMLIADQVEEGKWQPTVIVDHQTFEFGPLCESEGECQWWCSQFKIALTRAGARFS